MSTVEFPAPVRLAKRGLFRLPDAAEVQIECRSGSLWITVDDDPRDFIVEAGERFTSEWHRPAIVYALQPAELRVVQHPLSRAPHRHASATRAAA